MSDKVTFSKEEIAQIEELREQMFGIITTAGQLAMSRITLLTRLESIKMQEGELVPKFEELSAKEAKLITQLSEKYGVGSLDLDTGEFIPEK